MISLKNRHGQEIPHVFLFWKEFLEDFEVSHHSSHGSNLQVLSQNLDPIEACFNVELEMGSRGGFFQTPTYPKQDPRMLDVGRFFLGGGEGEVFDATSIPNRIFPWKSRGARDFFRVRE